MAKTISELIKEQKALEEYNSKGLSLADSASTRAPSELSTAGLIKDDEEEDGKYLRLAESIAGEVGGGVALAKVTAPLLGGGLPGIGAYVALNGLGNLGLNYWAQSHRDPDAEYSPEEGIATTAINTLGPLTAYKKVSQLSRLKQTGVAAAEGTAMAFTEDLLRQGLEIGTGKRTDGISVQQLGFSGAAGLLFGGGVGYLTSGKNFHKLGASASDTDKMKKVAEINAAKRISSIDSMLENPEVTGEYRDLLLRERREIKDTLETIRVGDKEYLEGLKADAAKQEQEQKQAIVDRLRKLEEPEVGEGTVLRPEAAVKIEGEPDGISQKFKDYDESQNPEYIGSMENPHYKNVTVGEEGSEYGAYMNEVGEIIDLRADTPISIDKTLENLDDDALEEALRVKKNDLEDLENWEDDSKIPKGDLEKIIELRSEVEAFELEDWRRNVEWRAEDLVKDPEAINDPFNDLFGKVWDEVKIDNDMANVKVAMAFEAIKKNGLENQFESFLKAQQRSLGTQVEAEDAEFLFKTQMEKAVAAYKKFSQPKPKPETPAIEAKPTAASAPTPEPVTTPTKPTKLTPEQKLEALERMGMSDEDLSKVLEGKSEIIPLNLAAFTTDDGVQRSMAAILEQLGDKIKSSRIKTDKESLIKQVVSLRKKLDPELDEAKFVQQIAKESEDIIFKTALADSMTFSAFDDWFKKVESNTDLNDPVVATRLMAEMDRLQVFVEESARISSSAGKLLQSRKITKEQIAANINSFERKATKAEKDLVEELIKYPDELSPSELKEQLEKLGGLKNVKALLNEIRLVKDPHKLGKLLEISKRSTGEKFGRVGKELIYDGVLSAPPTQAAAASGNAMMSLYSLLNQGVGGIATGNLEQTRMALRTSKYLLYGIDDAFQAARLAAADSQGSMSLNNHYEKIGEKAFTMESTGLSGPIGETVENTGELLSFGPKGLVFQDEFYRHLFGKAQARALLAEEYNQLVKRGEAPVGQIKDYMESRLARYFVDGKRFKTKNDVEMEALAKARDQGLSVEEIKDFTTEYVRDNWTNKLSSEIEYMKDFGDKITFQRELSSDYGVLEAGATKLGELRQKSSVLEMVQLFLRTPTNMFMELGGTLSGGLMIPGMNKITFQRTLEELRSDNPSIRAQARGRQVVGAGLWASALYLADQGIVTGEGPKDYKERATKMSTGWEPHAINMSAAKRFWDNGDAGGDKMGDAYLPLSRLGSIADVYGVSATLLRAKEDNSMPDEEFDQVISSVQLALTTMISDKTYLMNISELNDGLFRGKWEESGKSGANALFNSINRMAVPSAMKAAAQLNDPYLRQINEPMEQFKMAFAKTRRELDPKRDELGIPKPASQYDAIGQSINYLSPMRVESLRTSKATKKDVEMGRASKVGEKLFTKEDEARMILAEVGGRFKFSRPEDGVPGLNLKKLKVQKDYGFGLEQTLYDRWQQLFAKLKPADAVIKAYNRPKFQRMGKVPKGSPITNARQIAIEAELRALRNKALNQLVKENPELKAQYYLLRDLTKKTILEGQTAPRKVVAPELVPLLD